VVVSKIYPIASVPSRPIWNIFTLLIYMLSEPLNLFRSNLPSRVKVELNKGGLVISRGVYGREVPSELIIKEGIKTVNLNIEREYQPIIKTSGVELPFYKEGWFRLRNGERALVYLTDLTKTVYIPTKNGYSIILSINEREKFLRLLKKLA